MRLNHDLKVIASSKQLVLMIVALEPSAVQISG